MTRAEKLALEYAGLKEIPDEEERYFNKAGCEKYDAFLAGFKASKAELEERLAKAEKTASDAAWQREYNREIAWIERGDDGLDWMRMP